MPRGGPVRETDPPNKNSSPFRELPFVLVFEPDGAAGAAFGEADDVGEASLFGEGCSVCRENKTMPADWKGCGAPVPAQTSHCPGRE
jgi:hypothetical protein